MLVVGLAAIIVICCTATFFLLRGHKVDPFEQHARRVLAGKREATLYEMPLGPQGIRQKFKRLFTFGRKRDGWIKADSGDNDEWDASDRLVYDHSKENEDPETYWNPDPRLYDAPQPNAVHVSRNFPRRGETSDSIELTAPSFTPLPPSTTPSLLSGPASHRPYIEYTNPFAAESAIPLSDVMRMPTATGEQIPNRFEVLSSDTSSGIPNVRSMRKFDSGTKFKESLDF